MVPAWKIERELVRLKDRALRRLARVHEPIRQRLYDRRYDTEIRMTEGQLALGQKVAIFVLFQPRGLAPSVDLTLRYLAANGYSPFVVSNAPLTEADREVLRGRVWRVAERPNFGYDFGAYRDGIRLLWREGVTPDALVLMNDSTWFPLRADDDALARIDAMDDPFAGFVFKQEPWGKGNVWHVESHFLRFRSEALQSDQFRKFWTDYALTSDRSATIIRGEKGISQAMREAGFHPNSFVSFASFLSWFSTAPSETQRWVLEGATYHVDERIREIRRLLGDYADTPAWRLRAFAQVSDMLSSLEFFPSTTFIHASMNIFGLPFVKKSNENLYRVRKFGGDRLHLARQKVLQMHDARQIAPLDPVILRELHSAVLKAKPMQATGSLLQMA